MNSKLCTSAPSEVAGEAPKFLCNARDGIELFFTYPSTTTQPTAFSKRAFCSNQSTIYQSTTWNNLKTLVKSCLRECPRVFTSRNGATSIRACADPPIDLFAAKKLFRMSPRARSSPTGTRLSTSKPQSALDRESLGSITHGPTPVPFFSSFDNMDLKPELLRGVYAYGCVTVL